MPTYIIDYDAVYSDVIEVIAENKKEAELRAIDLANDDYPGAYDIVIINTKEIDG